MSVLFADPSGARDFDFEEEQPAKGAEGATARGVAGGVLGGLAGWAISVGTLALPGLGPFVATGPILSGLSGAAAGAAVGGIAGALVGLGIPEYEAKQYEGRLKRGGALIAVHSDDALERDRARRIFESEGAEGIRTAEESGAVDEPRARRSSEQPRV